MAEFANILIRQIADGGDSVTLTIDLDHLLCRNRLAGCFRVMQYRELGQLLRRIVMKEDPNPGLGKLLDERPDRSDVDLINRGIFPRHTHKNSIRRKPPA